MLKAGPRKKLIFEKNLKAAREGVRRYLDSIPGRREGCGKSWDRSRPGLFENQQGGQRVTGVGRRGAGKGVREAIRLGKGHVSHCEDRGPFTPRKMRTLCSDLSQKVT